MLFYLLVLKDCLDFKQCLFSLKVFFFKLINIEKIWNGDKNCLQCLSLVQSALTEYWIVKVAQVTDKQEKLTSYSSEENFI